MFKKHPPKTHVTTCIWIHRMTYVYVLRKTSLFNLMPGENNLKKKNTHKKNMSTRPKPIPYKT